MRKELHVLECGAVKAQRLYTIGELIPIKLIDKLLTNETLKDVGARNYPENKNYNKMAHNVGMLIVKMFFSIVVDKLMNSNRVLLPARIGTHPPKEMYITDVQQSHKKFLNSHSDGKVYNAVITGFNPPISIKFGGKRKQELKDRLEEGQTFY